MYGNEEIFWKKRTTEIVQAIEMNTKAVAHLNQNLNRIVESLEDLKVTVQKIFQKHILTETK